MPYPETGTIEEQVRYILRIRLKEGDDLDWDTLLDREALEMAYDMAGSLIALGEELSITDFSARRILMAHGIELHQQGGKRTPSPGDRKSSTTIEAEMLQMGKDYGFTHLQLGFVRAHARQSIATCPAICPLALFCWDRPWATGHRKRDNCRLADHLVAVGLSGKNGHGPK